MQLFYNPDLSEQTSEFAFSKEESRHVVKVLRKKEGDVLHITNGKGWCFKAVITVANQNKCIIEVVSHVFHEKKPYTLHLAVAPTKLNDRYEWFLEKATEIGVDTITPIICDRSERKHVKLVRYEKILQSAMKQSLHYYLPKINEPIQFNTFVNLKHQGEIFIAHCEDAAKKSLKNEVQPKTEVLILIGPEGDFTDKEILQALQNDFKPVTLGQTRLRTETAAIVAAHSVAFINEN